MAMWPVRRMDELCEITSSKRIFAADYVHDGVPFYRGREITEKYKGNLDVTTELFITEEKFREIERKFGAPKQGDLLLTSVGTLGSVYLVKAGDRFYFKDGNLTWFRHFRGLDSQFLYYWLGSPRGKAELKKCTIGSSQSAFTIVLLKSIEIEVPSLPVQQRIAHILGVYDDLIEVNLRRIAILEEMARRLFDEWFLRFRYPGREAVQLVETRLGMVPEGWSIVRAEEMIDFDPRTKVPKEGIKRFVPMGSLDTVSSVISGWETRSGNSGSKFQNGDTLFARITPCLENGKTGLVNFLEVEETAFGSTEFTVMRGKGVSSSFVYLLARSEAFRAIAIKSMGGADGRQRVRTEALKGYEFAFPQTDLLSKFASVTDPMLQQVRVLANQNNCLRTARDLLLPKLISGQIDVSAAQERFAEAAE
ncbi:restriction endonuclease subunit S [Phyllobacterium sp. CCNWLW109]|uniref:restriction endonuclease subunit S n=1 Tax=Phyllobacterium sp. CCNWLW109 TaxID=3127479 RepID=UPI0030770893